MKQKKRKGYGGFSFAEVAIALSIVGVMSATAVPAIEELIQKGRHAEAQKDVITLVNAIESFHSVNQQYPLASTSSADSEDVLHTTNSVTFSTNFGAPNIGVSSGSPWNTTKKSSIQSFLGETNAGQYGGPFLSKDPLDPWGRPYVVSVGGYKCVASADDPEVGLPTQTDNNNWGVWVMSAGQDGQLKTTPMDTLLADGKDVGRRIFTRGPNCFLF